MQICIESSSLFLINAKWNSKQKAFQKSDIWIMMKFIRRPWSCLLSRDFHQILPIGAVIGDLARSFPCPCSSVKIFILNFNKLVFDEILKFDISFITRKAIIATHPLLTSQLITETGCKQYSVLGSMLWFDPFLLCNHNSK